jgi:uncharacterized protein (TIGR03545 family)
MLGANVEVGNARVSIIDRKVILSDFRVEDPRHAGGDLFDADRCELEFETQPLLHKQAVFTRGRLSGINFSAFDNQQSKLTDANGESSSSIGWLGNGSGVIASKWLAHVAERFKQMSPTQFESVQRTEAFCAKWAAQSAELEARGEELNQRLAELKQAVDAVQANPLRGDKTLDNLPKAISELQDEFAALSTELERLPDQLESERRAIVASRRQDEVLVRQRIALAPAETEALSGYLLQAQAAKPLNELIDCFRWLRAATPSNEVGKTRGEDLVFAASQRSPNLIVRALDLRGAARIAGQPVEFRGTISGLSTEPALMAEPVRLRLEATGSMPLQVQAIIDRSHGIRRDSLLVDCRGILLPKVELGAPAELAISMEPSVGCLSMSIAADGDRITGDIQMVQKNVRLKPTLAGSLDGVPIASALEETLCQIDSLATRISLGGTVARPTCTLWSNLGPATAEAIERAFDRATTQHGRELVATAGKQVDERLTGVESQMAEQQSRWTARISDVCAELRSIAANERSADRLSPERLGRRVPNGSLFR